MISFFKQIFTWWNKQTVGTFFYTLFTGKLVGKDDFGNKFTISRFAKYGISKIIFLKKLIK